MKRFSLLGLVGLLTGATALAQPLSLYINRGIIDEPVQIDAIAFANLGSFNVGFTSMPFDFQNTRFFTNAGTMSAALGYQFNTAFSEAKRQPAEVFVNEPGALVSVSGSSFGGGFFFIDNAGNIVSSSLGGFTSPGFLQVHANTIRNEGILSAGAGALLEVIGDRVDLARGGLETLPIFGGLDASSSSNYFPDVGLFDNYWAYTNALMSSATIVTGPPLSISVPSHTVTNGTILTPFGISAAFNIQNPISMVYTQAITPTNWLIQAAFVGIADTNLLVDIRFTDGDIFTNFNKTITASINLVETNVVTGEVVTNSLYWRDESAWTTNLTILTNLTAFTGRPAAYNVSRSPFFDWNLGFPGNAEPDPALIFNPGYSNVLVTNLYAAYSIEVDPLTSRPESVPGLDITDFPGRIEVTAKELDLTDSRMRANGLLSIISPDVTGIPRTAFESLNLNYDLGTKKEKLLIQNLAEEEVRRMAGTARAWSAVWTNLTGVLATNQVEEPPGSGTFTNVVVTNVVEIGIHVFVLDARPLRGLYPVAVHDFITHAKEVTIKDSMQVVKKFITDAERLTVEGNVTLTRGSILNPLITTSAEYFSATNAPNLLYFTNTGGFNTFNSAQFGNDRARPYASWVNRGSMRGAGHAVRAESFENAGTIVSNPDGLSIEAVTGRFQNGANVTVSDVRISGGDIKFQNYTNVTARGIYLTVTNSLADGGAGSNNLWQNANGVQLLIKPRLGDLLGTTIQTTPARFTRAQMIWSGEDRGVSAAGFENNASVGRLILNGGAASTVRFAGTGARNAIYIDFLDLQGPFLSAFNNGSLESALSISENMKVYFADSNVDPEQLNGLFEGRLRWVSEFVGPNSGVDVVERATGNTVRMNRAIRESETIDTDNDGIVNKLDEFPLDFDSIQVTLRNVKYNTGGSSGVSFSWQARPNTSYQVEYTTNLQSGVWQPLTNIVNKSLSPSTATVQDKSGSAAQKYYRVRFTP